MDPAVRYSIEDPRTLVQTSGLSFFAGATAKVQQQAHKLTVPRKADGRTLDVESFQGYRLAVWKLPLAVLVLIGTAGTILFFRGRARLSVLLYLTPCRLAGAGYVLVTLTNGRQTLTRTKTFKIDTPINFACSTVRASGMGPVEHQHVSLLNAFYNRFIYNQALDTYVPIPSVPNELTPQLVEVANWLAGRTEAATVTKQPTEDLVTTFRRAKWDRAGRCRVYGRNLRRVLLPGVVEQMFLQMFSPYCIYLYAALTFQVYFFAYYWWAVVIGSITVGMVCGNVLQVYRNNNGLTKLVHYVVDVEMLENGRTRTIKSTELVPGDIVIVKPGRMPCDMVLLWGRAIMDENMLTGEVVPIRKTPFLAQHAGLAYRPDVHSACTLQGGTEVLQAWTPGQKEAVLAMVCRTRFATAEGQLLAAVATPVANSDPQYVKDILSFITAATILGFITLIPVLAKADTDGLGPKDIAILIGNMITIATPPAIPTCLAVATAFSIFRLWRRSIIVSNAERIRLAGHISMVCFDKTGTITEAGMHFKGVLPVVEGHIMSLQVQQFEWSQPMRVLLATCHGLISLDGRLMGEDLDKQPFVSMGASFVGADLVSLPSAQQGLMRTSFEAAGVSREDAAEYEDDQWLSLLRQFEFSSNRQRNVVVVKALDSDDYVVNAKGSPEAILKLVDPQSVPSNFETVLDDYASLGFRMVAIATGRLPRHVTPEEVASQTQEEIEAAANLRLLGLCVIVNKLHPESKGTLKRLHNRAQMRTVMVTGDHVITAISVAKMCGMMYERRPVCVIDAVPKGRMDESLHIIFTAVHTQPKHSVALPRQQALQTIAAGQSQCAITGPGFVEMLRRNDREVIDVVLQNITVAARMLPHHKQDLVALLGLGVDAGRYGHEHIKGLGHFVGFCGDGLNDMAALKTAHVGVSLSATDACVAAPFTARNRNVASMAAMLAEGRCSLVITYYMFQYMIIYSIDELILTNIASLYGLSPANSQYLLMDVLFVLVLTILIALTGPETSLTREKPPGRLMSLANVLPCIVQMAVATVAQLGSLKLIQLQPWYVKTDVLANPDLAGGCQTVEVMVVFLVSLGHLIFPVFILSRHTRPHTRALRTNKPLALWLVACSMFICYMIFETRPNKLTEYYCQVDTLPMKFRGQLFAYIIACFIVAVAADSLLRRMMKRFGLNGPPSTKSGIWRRSRVPAQSNARTRLPRAHSGMFTGTRGTQRSGQSMQSRLSSRHGDSAGLLAKHIRQDAASAGEPPLTPLIATVHDPALHPMPADKRCPEDIKIVVAEVPRTNALRDRPTAAQSGSKPSTQSSQPTCGGIGRFRLPEKSPHAGRHVRDEQPGTPGTPNQDAPLLAAHYRTAFQESQSCGPNGQAASASLPSPERPSAMDPDDLMGEAGDAISAGSRPAGGQPAEPSNGARPWQPPHAEPANSNPGAEPIPAAGRATALPLQPLRALRKAVSARMPGLDLGKLKAGLLSTLSGLGSSDTASCSADRGADDSANDSDDASEASRDPTQRTDSDQAAAATAAAFRAACSGLPDGVDYYHPSYPNARNCQE